jgi:hypothetical protein
VCGAIATGLHKTHKYGLRKVIEGERLERGKECLRIREKEVILKKDQASMLSF